MESSLIKETPWDEAAFGVPTWELTAYNEETICHALDLSGHHSIRVDPLVDKRLLHENGFYYCDTLLEPYCNQDNLIAYRDERATISKLFDKRDLLKISREAFKYDRFHRDFMLDHNKADDRYQNWLGELIKAKQVQALFWKQSLAGFIACLDNKLILHAISDDFRGNGYAKYWWSEVSLGVLGAGYEEVQSSISAANIAALNLYASLGFRFKKPLDLYHKLVY